MFDADDADLASHRVVPAEVALANSRTAADRVVGGRGMFRFRCATCSEWHEGMPGFAATAPLYYYWVPQIERAARCKLTSDTCIVDGNAFFVRGCIEITVSGASEPFIWGAWVSLSRTNFEDFTAHLDTPERSQFGPYLGWLSANFLVYPDTENLKARLHLRDNGVRPYIELQPTEHPLAVEQRNGIDVSRVAEIFAAYHHRSSTVSNHPGTNAPLQDL